MSESKERNKHCLNCREHLLGDYCHQCGEKVIKHKDKSILSIASEFFNALTFFDNKFLRTIWTLFRKPGELTVAFNAGFRKKYTRPISLFLFINILIFLSDVSGVFDSPFEIQMNMLPHSGIVKSMVEKKLAGSAELTMENYAEKYSAVSANVSKTAIFLIIPIMAIFIHLFNLRKRKYYVDHFVFSLHSFSFALLYVTLILLFLLRTLQVLFASEFLRNLLNDPQVVFLLAGTISPYFVLAGKRVYQDSWLISILKGIAYFVFLAAALMIYRFFLFLIVFYLT